jgi:hypothetical protein
MVSKKLIKSLDFETIEDYFNYIVDSKINGNRQQAQELYNNLSTRQKEAFAMWYQIFYYYEAIDNDTTAELEYTNLITYLNS